MKKAIYLVAILFTTHVFGGEVFKVKDNYINIGIGFGSTIGVSNYTSQSLGFNASYERGVWDVAGPGVVSLGGYLGFRSYKYETYEYVWTNQEKWNYTMLGARAVYHYSELITDLFDVYGGAMLTYNIISYSHNYSSPMLMHDDDGNFFSLSAFVGGRCVVSPNLSAFAELGFGASILNIGAAFKF